MVLRRSYYVVVRHFPVRQIPVRHFPVLHFQRLRINTYAKISMRMPNGDNSSSVADMDSSLYVIIISGWKVIFPVHVIIRLGFLHNMIRLNGLALKPCNVVGQTSTAREPTKSSDDCRSEPARRCIYRCSFA